MPNLRREDLRGMARKMIDDQTRDVARMRAMLNQSTAPARAGTAFVHTAIRKVLTMSHQMPSKEMLACMKVCGECASMCNQCGHHCLQMGGPHASPEHQGLMRDCAEICGLAACFMGRSSHHAGPLCRECAEICNACAASCERLGGGDEMMARCAKVCRECAEACERMAAAHA